MARIGVDADRLREGAKGLKGTSGGARPSADGVAGFGSSVAGEAVHRFEGYWVAGQSSVDALVIGLSGALEQAARAYEQRNAEDADRFRVDGGEFIGF